MSFFLSKKSWAKLEQVHPDLIAVVKLAIKLTEVDFAVTCGLRTVEEQRVLVEAGKSKTMNSKHLSGVAVDLTAIVDGAMTWDKPVYYKLAEAMREAGRQIGVDLIWGGVWDKRLNLLDDLEAEVKLYADRQKAKSPPRKPFFDGPHFELR